MRIFYTAVDCGDGSMSVRFFNNELCIKLLEQHDLKGFRGEGGGYFDCDNFTGDFDTLEDVVKEILT